MSRQLGIATRDAFQRNHFLLVDAGEAQAIGLHQYRPLVDENHIVRTVGKNELSDAARVEYLSGVGYCTIPRLYAVQARGLVDVQKTDGVMHRFAGMCAAIMQRSGEVHAKRWRDLLGAEMAGSFSSISATEFMRIAERVAQATRDSALAFTIGNGAVYVTSAELGAEIFVELETEDDKRAPQEAFENGMYECRGNGPVHLIGGAEALVVSRASIKFAEGIKEDTTAADYAASGMPAEAIAAMHLQITREENNAVFLTKGDAVPSLPIPQHGVMMRAMAGGVGVWDGDRLIHVLDSDNGATLLCHPSSGKVMLKPTTQTAQLLKVPFKLN